MQPNDEIRALRAQWVIEEMPAGLADRISRHALAHTQRRPFFARVKNALAMPESAMQWKGGFAVAACIMLAILMMGQGTAQQKMVYKKPLEQLVEEMYFVY